MADQEVVTQANSADDVVFTKQDDGTWAVDFQPTDEAGNPIGRAFRATGKTQKECFSAFQTAYNESVRALHRTKTGQTTPDLSKAKRNQTVEAKPREWTAEEAFQITSELQNPGTMRKAVRKAIEDELGISLDELRKTPGTLTQVDAYFAGKAWAEAHYADFYNCPENNKAIGNYLAQNNLACTKENLDIAFNYLKDSLIQRPQEETQNNTATNTQQDSNQSQQRTRSASSGLLPGDSTGTRPKPGSQGKGLTWAIVDNWSDAEWEKAKRDPVLIQQINALPQRGRR